MTQDGSCPFRKTNHVIRGLEFWIGWYYANLRTSLVAQTVKNLPAMWETWVQPLGWEDSLDEGMATQLQDSCLENPHGQRILVGYSPWGSQRVRHDWTIKHTHTTSTYGEWMGAGAESHGQRFNYSCVYSGILIKTLDTEVWVNFYSWQSSHTWTCWQSDMS